MSLNLTPNSERVHITIFGRRNSGKSSIINAITSQGIAIVSEKPGTTTDPVSKAMELLPLGPVLITDTAGFDDNGDIGALRIEKTYKELRKTDIAVLVINAEKGVFQDEIDFMRELEKRKLPYIICINKCGLVTDSIFDDIKKNISFVSSSTIIFTDTINGIGIETLKECISKTNLNKEEKHIISDYIDSGDIVVLVIPIDESAPKGRIILPQQQVLRDLLDKSATAVVTKETELEATLAMLAKKPKVVVTDSQVFGYVSKIVPEDVYLTSFSILMSNYKGDLEWQVRGAKALDELQDGDKVLISEGCTHHRQCKDIGTVKLPQWIKEYTGKQFEYAFTSGGEYPSDLSEFKYVIHCGGCTLNEKEMKYRIDKAKEYGIPITNYGVIISYMNGILERSLHLLTITGK